jgi:hypothetical protein
VPGAKVQIEQHQSIKEARVKEARMIIRSQPPYNKQGKYVDVRKHDGPG